MKNTREECDVVMLCITEYYVKKKRKREEIAGSKNDCIDVRLNAPVNESHSSVLAIRAGLHRIFQSIGKYELCDLWEIFPSGRLHKHGTGSRRKQEWLFAEAADLCRDINAGR